jgi:hypothetical protein
MNCIFPEALGERAFNLVKAQLNEMVFCHDEGKYRDAFKEIAEKLYHMPDKLACIEKRYQNPATFAQFALLSVRGSMRKRGSAHAEQNHSSIDSHIPIISGTLEPEELIEKLLIRHDELVAKQENYRRTLYYTCKAKAEKMNCATLQSAIKCLSKYSYELFEKEYYAAQRYVKDRRASSKNYIEDFESMLTAKCGARCKKPNCISMNFQCKHEIFMSMHSLFDDRVNDLFLLSNFGTRHLQQHVYQEIMGGNITNDEEEEEDRLEQEEKDNLEQDIGFALTQTSNEATIPALDETDRNSDIGEWRGSQPTCSQYS